jgi:hypothetical protein
MEEMRKHSASTEQQSLQNVIDQAREQKAEPQVGKVEKK